MDILIKEDIWLFIYSVSFGGLIGVFYSLFQFLRLINSNFIFNLILDIFFWFLGAVLTFIYMFAFFDGNVRLIYLAFLFLGWWLYFISFGKLVNKLISKILKPVKILNNKIKAKINSLSCKLKGKIKENYEKKLKKYVKNSIYLFHFPKKNTKIYNDKYSYALRRRR